MIQKYVPAWLLGLILLGSLLTVHAMSLGTPGKNGIEQAMSILLSILAGTYYIIFSHMMIFIWRKRCDISDPRVFLRVVIVSLFALSIPVILFICWIGIVNNISPLIVLFELFDYGLGLVGVVILSVLISHLFSFSKISKAADEAFETEYKKQHLPSDSEGF